MSGKRLTRGQRIAGKVGAAAVIAAMTSLPSELGHLLTGGQDTTQMAWAGKPPPSPPPPAAAPAAEPLNVAPSVHWFAAWDEANAPGSSDFFPTPSTYTGIANTQTQLNGSAVAGKPLGIKVEVPLSSADATNLFNTHYTGGKAISYVFGDFEGGTQATALTNITTLVNQVRGSTWSKNAYVGHYDLTPLNDADDPSYHAGGIGPNASAHRHWGKPEYDSSHVNMANTQLYPGAADFRNKSTFDWPNANIRTGLFIAPLERMTATQNVLNASYSGHKQIPWVARFNNAGNTSLDSDQNSSNGYQFVPGAALPQAGLNSTQTANQMLSRGDFSAQILHYRMRGAYSVNLFKEGDVGSVIAAAGNPDGAYTSAQAKQDVRDGWYNHSWNGRTNQIFAQSDAKPATMTLNPIVDSGTGMSRAESSGSLWSGTYSLNMANPASTNTVKGQNGKGALDILVSNLDTADHLVKFGTVDVYDVFTDHNANGYTYSEASNDLTMGRNALVQQGMHKLLQFDLVTTRVYNNASYTGGFKTQTVWLLNQNYNVFNNNNGRNDIGIPEPTTFGMLAAGGTMAVVCRRQRRKPAKA